MKYDILLNGEIINTIVADEEFCAAYCNKNGYTYEVVEEPKYENLPAIKIEKITQSKINLATWLENNPILWKDGKFYSVTSEKQNLLMGNIAAYQIEVQIDPDAIVTWNATGEECTPWDINNLCALAVDIKNYVKPRVSYQQTKEVQINACETVEDVMAVVVNYDTLE